MESELLFAETMRATNRRYDFEVREASSGDRYLLVRESHQQQDKLVTSGTIMVFADHLQGFRRAMRVALQFMKGNPRHSTPRADRTKAYDVGGIRQSFPQAYAKWASADDDRLKALFANGWKIDDLAAEFRRKPSAIRSRLRKLGLVNDLQEDSED